MAGWLIQGPNEQCKAEWIRRSLNKWIFAWLSDETVSWLTYRSGCHTGSDCCSSGEEAYSSGTLSPVAGGCRWSCSDTWLSLCTLPSPASAWKERYNDSVSQYRLQSQLEANVITTVSRSNVSSLSLRPTLASHSDTWLSLYTLLPLASHWRQCYQVTVTQGCLCTRYWLQYLPENNVSKSQWHTQPSLASAWNNVSKSQWNMAAVSMHPTVSSFSLKKALKGHSDIHYTVSNTCLKTLPMRYRDTHSCLQHQLENNVTKSQWHTLPSPVSSWRQRYQVRMTHVTVSSIVMKTTLPSQNDTRYRLQYQPEDNVTKSM